MKRIVLILMAVCLLVSLSPASFAASSAVVDNAGVLSGSEISDLSDTADSISEEYGISVVILTESYLTDSTYTMADDHFYNGGYGDDGILFLLVMESRDWEIATYGEAVDLIPHAQTENLFLAASDDLAEDDYYGGFTAYLRELETCLSGSYGYGDDTYLPVSNETEPTVKLLGPILAGLIVALISLFVMRSKMNSVRAQRAATNYMLPGSYSLTRQRDLYLYSNTTRTRRAQNSSSGSSGGRSGGGGGSRGGSRGKF